MAVVSFSSGMHPEFQEPLVATLDVGTSSLRALLFDGEGRRIEGVGASVTYRPDTWLDGRAVLDPALLVEQARSCLDSVVAQRRIAAISVATFWHSLMGLNSAGRPFTPVYLWADTRSTADALTLRQELDEREVHSRTGCRLHSSYWPAKLRWVRRTEPDLWGAARQWCSLGEHLVRELSGEYRCSLSMASGTGLLGIDGGWDLPLLRSLEIDPDVLPPLVETSGPLGEGAPGWLPAIGDGAASSAGSGCVDASKAALNIGTSSALRVVTEVPPQTIPPSLWRYRLDGSHHIVGGALSEGGNLWTWLRANLRLPALAEEEAALSAMAPDGHGLTVLPFIAGERSPGWRDEARVTLHGISLATTTLDVMRAALEAIAYRLASVHSDLTAVLKRPPVVVAGGGAVSASPTWLQIMADVLNEPVQLLADPAATSRGAALLALRALDRLPDLSQASFPLAMTFEPDQARHAIYQAAIERQAKLYEAVGEGALYPAYD